MSEEYANCILRKGADVAVIKPTRELCFALIDTDSMQIVNVYSPGTSWLKAMEGARHFECGYGQVVCDVAYSVLPMFKLYKPHSELTTTAVSSQRIKEKETNYGRFKEMEMNPLATRKFAATNATNFLGVKVNDEVIKIFPRGTPMNQVSGLSAVIDGDIVLVKAKAVYSITGLVRIEKTYGQLRQN